MYKISYHRRAFKQLKKLPKAEQRKIARKINQLKENPLNPNLDIRPFYDTEKSWRVRAGNLRAIYTFDSNQKIIYIEYLGYRGSVYK